MYNIQHLELLKYIEKKSIRLKEKGKKIASKTMVYERKKKKEKREERKKIEVSLQNELNKSEINLSQKRQKKCEKKDIKKIVYFSCVFRRHQFTNFLIAF